jgi:peptidoglycan/LPS O-acetylase OafA/YrhL
MNPVDLRPETSTTRQIVGLDAIRFMAALMVMTFHLGFWIWAGGPAHPGLGGVRLDYTWLAPFTAPGWIGVDVFFVISGFVIVYSATGATPFTFFRSRFLRLVPAAWICASITLLALLVNGKSYLYIGELIKPWLKAVIFYPFPYWIDGSYWTLGIEVSFYAIIFMVLAGRTAHRIFAVTGLFGIISSTFWIMSFTADKIFDTGDAFANTAIDRVTTLALLRHGAFFALGAFLCLAKFRTLRRTELGCILLFIVGGVLEIRYSSHAHDAEAGFHVPTTIPVLIWLGFLAAIMASVRWNAKLVSYGGGFVSTMRAIGLMTYPLYLIHQHVGYIIIDTMRRYVNDYTALLIAVAICLLLAFVISGRVEPALRALLGMCLQRARDGATSLIERTSRSRLGTRPERL